MSETQQSKFEGYAIVEIMGHQQVAGYVTTEAFGSVVMFKVVQQEIPPTEKTLGYTQYVNCEHCPEGSRVRISRERAETYVGVGSVYRMTPCTEEQANAAQPAKVEIIEKAERKLVAAGINEAILGGEDDDDDGPF